MDEGLFAKHLKRLNERSTIKQSILQLVKELTGVQLQEEELELQGKKLRILTSSTKRAVLIQRKLKESLLEKGYSVTF